MSGAPTLALVGLPGAGKSTLGPLVARRLGARFVDVDARVEERAGMPVPALIDSQGEARFRQMELDALREVLAEVTSAVISCGGGLIAQPSAAELLRHAVTVWLDAPDEVLLERLGDASGRPLLRDDPPRRLAELRAAREAVYARSTVRVDVSTTVEDAVSRVLAAVRREGAIRVELGERSYGITVGRGVASQIDEVVALGGDRACVVVADRAVEQAARAVAAALGRGGRAARVMLVDAGEHAKSWESAGRLLEQLAAARLERDGVIVAVGGGTLGDLTGFVAATYQRGVDWINVPTTLLAMVDSAVGGKTGVNLSAGKNLAGAFWQPRAVVCDVDVLAGLADRAYRAAMGEIVKYAMIVPTPLVEMLDTRFDALLARDPDALVDVVRECCAIKADVVSGDEREGGRRAILNYGHTVAHALEAATGYGDALHHGEAVLHGMRVAGRLSVEVRGCPAADIAWQDALIGNCGAPPLPPLDADDVVRRTHGDKKSRGGAARWVLLDRRGAAVTGNALPDDVVRAVIGATLRG